MIVEDDPGHAEFTRRMFADQEASGVVTRFADGAAALEFLRAAATGGGPVPLPDLILLDLHPARMDGFTLLAEIKHDPRLKAIPVVVLSASGAAADIALAYRRHANSYLVKPAGREDFTRMMHDLGCYWLVRNRPAPVPAPW